MTQTDMEVLGDAVLRDLVGDATPGGFDPTFLVNMAAEAANRGIKYKQDEDAKKTSAADVNAKVTAIIQADREATKASADWKKALLNTSEAGQAQAAALQLVAEQATEAQDAAAAGLSPEVSKRRVEVANQAAKAAAQKAASAATDAARNAKDPKRQLVAKMEAIFAQCARDTAIKAAGGGGGGGAQAAITQTAQAESGSSFLTRVRGGIPVWGWGLGGAAVASGLVVLLVKLLKRRQVA